MLSPGSHLNDMKKEFEKYKEKYEKLKCDVNIKMKFLEENQVNIYIEYTSNRCRLILIF